jgi:hypothetical protein
MLKVVPTEAQVEVAGRSSGSPPRWPTSNRPSKIAGPLVVMPKEVYDSVGHRM